MSNKRPDPWVILGIPRTSTLEEIKTQYKKLALSLHPDKCDPSATPEERKEREERFKDVSIAYQVAIEYAKSREKGAPDWDEYPDAEKWRAMWERVENVIRNKNIMNIFSNVVKETFKDATNIAISRMMSATASSPSQVPTDSDTSSSVPDSDDESNDDTNSQTDQTSNHTDSSYDTVNSSELDPDPHIFKLMIGMEELHVKKTKKVRLFLTQYPSEPFDVNIDLDQFPEMMYIHHHKGINYKVVIQMKLKSHPVYYWDDLLNNWDLYTTVPISLYEYFTGSKRYIPVLGDTNNDILTIDIPAFHDVKKSIVFEKKGLRGRGSLYVIIEIRLPTKEEWDTNFEDKTEKEKFLNTCKKINAV